MLLEVLVSLLIFSLGVLGCVALQARASQISTAAEERNRASLLVDDMVATMWAQKTSDTATLEDEISVWQERVSTVALSGMTDAIGTVSVDSNGVATVSISWRDPWRAEGDLSTYSTKVVIQ